jgi:hypothetical protein
MEGSGLFGLWRFLFVIFPITCAMYFLLGKLYGVQPVVFLYLYTSMFTVECLLA